MQDQSYTRPPALGRNRPGPKAARALRLDPEGIRYECVRRGVYRVRDAAAEIGISKRTLDAVYAGRKVDARTIERIVSWLEATPVVIPSHILPEA